MTYVFPVIGVLIGLGPGFLLARKGQVWIVVAFVIAGLGLGAWMLRESRAQIDGTDHLGYGVIILVMIAPALGGLIAGALWGLVVRARSGQRAPHDGDTP